MRSLVKSPWYNIAMIVLFTVFALVEAYQHRPLAMTISLCLVVANLALLIGKVLAK